MRASRYPDLRDPTLDEFLVPYDGAFASGAPANNKLDLDGKRVISQNPRLFELIVRQLVAVVEAYEPDLIVPVPNGANLYAQRVARALGFGCRCVILSKDQSTRGIVVSSATQEAIEAAESILVLEDVANRFTNTRLLLAALAKPVGAVVAVFDRGDPSSREPLPADTRFEALVAETIDPLITPASPQYRHLLNGMLRQRAIERRTGYHVL